MLKVIRYNIGLCIGIVLAISLVFWAYGCESTAKSPVTGEPVTQAELTIEVNGEAMRLEAELNELQKRAALSYQEIARKDEIIQKLFDFASITATSNTFNPTGLITLIGSVIGIGAVVDNRIKDVVIANRPITTTKTKTNSKKG